MTRMARSYSSRSSRTDAMSCSMVSHMPREAAERPLALDASPPSSTNGHYCRERSTEAIGGGKVPPAGASTRCVGAGSLRGARSFPHGLSDNAQSVPPERASRRRQCGSVVTWHDVGWVPGRPPRPQKGGCRVDRAFSAKAHIAPKGRQDRATPVRCGRHRVRPITFLL